MRRAILLLMASVLLCSVTADAGVKGNRYNGYVLIDDSNPANVVGETMDFRVNNTFSARENQQGGTFTFNGTFTETDLGIISFWNAEISDGSPDGKGFFNGISLFGGFVSTVISSNDVGHPNQPIAHGYIFRGGAAQRESGSKSTGGIAGGTP